MENESNCRYVCSRGIMKSCDVYSSKPRSSIKEFIHYDLSKMVDGCTIHVCSSAIPHFKSFVDQIPCSFILVSNDCDQTTPTDIFPTGSAFQEFIDNPKIIHWYAQNCVPSIHPKLTQIPIGLDYHTMSERDHQWGDQITPNEQETQLIHIRSISKPTKNRICKAYANFQFQICSRNDDRRDAINKIPSDLVYYEPCKIKRYDTWTRQAEYAYVVSPNGYGYDCHRTWEALCLGCIPIVKTSIMDPLFTDLPVLIVKDWDDITEELLQNTINVFENKQMKMEKLSLKYWIDKIRSAIC